LWVNEQERKELQDFSPYYDELISFPLPTARSMINCVLALPSAMPLQAVYSWCVPLWQRISERVQQSGPDKIDAVHVEHLRGSQYGVRLKNLGLSRGQHELPIIWDSVDCISHLFKQAAEKSQQGLKRRITQFDLQRTAKREGWLASFFDQVLVTSQNDKQALLDLVAVQARKPNITVIPNGVDLDYFQPGIPDQREEATLVISGKMSYHANVSMVLYLVREVLPLVWNVRPEVKLSIVGKDPGPEIQALTKNPMIRITGTVPSLLPYLQTATAAVAPIQYGAGIQNKVLEAMACATPVIASPIATSALGVRDNEEVLLANSPEEWTRQIINLLASPEKQRRIGSAGYAYVHANHRWSDIARRLEENYTR
jgi:glycosyltransferase involved in cell wall biosynthesis